MSTNHDQTAAPVTLPVQGSHEITCTYVNWRGDVSVRRIGVMSVWFGTTEWHSGPQWFVHGIDLEKNRIRDFAMRDMTDVVYT